MRAPVYRHLDTPATLFGLSAPFGWMVFLLAFFVPAWMNQFLVGVVASVGYYLAMRIAGYGRPENFIRDWIVFHLQTALHDGRFSSAARTPPPHFPFGGYAYDPRLQARIRAAAETLSRNPSSAR